ncbi:LacI family DNA-binding transcriptional regulator [Paraburkholderia silvatlantica]|uniref:LacI family transcriptional regulator n=1 Tax=Paraburkholderia silvatlantica TaxID=321895 RepID=A0A2U1A4Z9_9BURK|nr:LacI family DNA-binding transcriptional regulator [Paraburkholderia silvatlantica]MBB2931542.1 LacI family transcriptional regulator [Paraburkholderia silvatlantica]PVY26666.1 LacI family transcriptional regulator [Paraburkholderia silvatlantica]PXW32931.1 LacI family transcriptional regulator [Paraburkholderia silvatlantica]PYE14410.1 LacI family transcriptional regulator [Paraburkholderia silvatlantica]TDQ81681.1 LacI family transcriptional regulator [Paraburkholderia silvatlantica]
MPKVSTIRDVAEYAKVSKATVSRYLNGSLALPPETSERIDAAIAALNYRQNSLARRLSLGSSETIGLAMPDVANPFFAEIADEVELAASEHGYGLSLCITRNQFDRESLYIGWLDTQHLDGLILVSNRPDDGSLRNLIGTRGNIVLIDEDIPGADVPKVFVDNVQGGYLATRHLLAAGHRRIAHVSGPRGLFTVQERCEGYRRALAEAGIAFDESLVRFGSYERHFGATALTGLLELPSPPTAVFAASDYLAVGMLELLRDRAINVPADMSIVGFDDMEFASLLMPPISTLRQSARELGRKGVDLLLARLTGDVPAVVERLPVRLIERASVAPPPR